jgi:hypothetical protein
VRRHKIATEAGGLHFDRLGLPGQTPKTAVTLYAALKKMLQESSPHTSGGVARKRENRNIANSSKQE